MGSRKFNREVEVLAAILIAAALISAAWHYRDVLLPKRQTPIVAPAPQAPVEQQPDEGPKHPIAPIETAPAVVEQTPPLPPLEESDEHAVGLVVDVFGSDVEQLLAESALIDKFVATVDNLPRDHVAEKIRPLRPFSAVFRADVLGNNDEPIYLSRDNYQRYDDLVDKLAATDIDVIAEAYRRTYPLLQQSYESLGYPNAYFNDRVVEVIDHLLETPQAEEPIELVRPHVLYQYANPELEELSSGQKLLLRMGPDHVATVKDFLRELRAELTGESME